MSDSLFTFICIKDLLFHIVNFYYGREFSVGVKPPCILTPEVSSLGVAPINRRCLHKKEPITYSDWLN